MTSKEILFLSNWRSKVLSDISWTALEIWSWTWINFKYYHIWAIVDALDTSWYMCDIASTKVGDKDIKIIWSTLNKARLDNSLRANRYDNIICTLVLCSIDNYEEFIKDIIDNYLVTWWKMIIIEHIESDNRFFRLLQHLLNPLQNILADWCNLTHRPNRYIKKLWVACIFEEFHWVFKNFYCAKYIKC